MKKQDNSIYLGVKLDKRSGKFEARTYNNKAKELFREFAKLNIINPEPNQIQQ